MTEQTRDDDIDQRDLDVDEHEQDRVAQKRAAIAKRAADGDGAVAVAALQQQMQHLDDLRALIKALPLKPRNKALGVCDRIEGELCDACAILELKLGEK